MGGISVIPSKCLDFQKHVVESVDFQISERALPPSPHKGGSGFPVKLLTLSHTPPLPPLVHHYNAAPHSSCSRVTMVMTPRKARAEGFDLNSVAMETPHNQIWVGAGRALTYCQRFETNKYEGNYV